MLRCGIFAIFCSLLIIDIGIAGDHAQEVKELPFGISVKDGMYWCGALEEFIKISDERQIKEAEYAARAKAIADKYPNVVWRLGRCFCPATRKYLERNPRWFYAINRVQWGENGSEKLIADLEVAAKSAPKFKKPARAFARSVELERSEHGFIIHKYSDCKKWEDRSDYPGEQGNPLDPGRILTCLGIDLGFTFQPQVKIPTLALLNETLAKLGINDRSFFEVDGEFTGREYLRRFVDDSSLPVARIEENGDATFFLHDMNFHVASFILLPQKVLQLAQKQTRALMDFCKFFEEKYPESFKLPKFKLMLERLIEDQVYCIDLSTGNMSLALSAGLKNNPSLESLELYVQSDRYIKSQLHAMVMAISGGKGLCERRSVYDFIHYKRYIVLRAFDEGDRESINIFEGALDIFLKNHSDDREFNEDIDIETYNTVYRGNKRQFAQDAADLFFERVRWVKTTISDQLSQCSE